MDPAHARHPSFGPQLAATLALLAGALTAMADPAAPLEDPGELRWQHRLIVVFTADASGRDDAREGLTAATPEIDERHIVWFVVTRETLDTNYAGALAPALAEALQRRYRRSAPADEVVLVGKDGGVKYRADALDLDRVFGEIDQMPMRRQEMRDGDAR